ncbi:transposable element Tc3 transposase [Trichonephila clavipes]|nr:transposable element Tc3 transposase [Trichonephila clavipes]
MTGHIYRDIILEQHVRLFRGEMGAEFLFMDDNARPHRANIIDECLQSEDITRIDWPAYSPNLNPIEHVWDMLGRRIAARQPPPTCLPELRRALRDEWCNIPQDQIDNLILSIPWHCKACIASMSSRAPVTTPPCHGLANTALELEGLFVEPLKLESIFVETFLRTGMSFKLLWGYKLHREREYILHTHLCGMQPKPSSLRAQAQLMRTETCGLLRIREREKAEGKDGGSRAGVPVENS